MVEADGDAPAGADQGPDVLLIAGLGDPAEAWQLQLHGLGTVTQYLLIGFPVPLAVVGVAGWLLVGMNQNIAPSATQARR